MYRTICLERAKLVVNKRSKLNSNYYRKRSFKVDTRFNIKFALLAIKFVVYNFKLQNKQVEKK